jgi:hypothetical protein
MWEGVWALEISGKISLNLCYTIFTFVLHKIIQERSIKKRLLEDVGKIPILDEPQTVSHRLIFNLVTQQLLLDDLKRMTGAPNFSKFPDIVLTSQDGTPVSLRAENGRGKLLVFYRGAFCIFCEGENNRCAISTFHFFTVP